MLKFIIIAIFLGWILWLFYTSFDDAFGPDLERTEQSATVACSDDVGFCPDGSSVRREGPNCTFAACPSE